MKVAKFGGTSMASAEQIKKVCSIVLSDPERRLVVVSAPGKRCKEDTKVTDLLICCAEKHLKGENADAALEAVVERYSEIIRELGLDKKVAEIIANDLKSRLQSDVSNKDKFMDLMKAAGEDNAAKVVAAYLQSQGINAEYIHPREAGMLLSNEYGNARVLPGSYEQLGKLRERDSLMIFPGFFGYSMDGDVVTFSRGGSDITGSILAAAVKADVYENFTDVDSVYAANPNVIANPQAISTVTYHEMRELSYAGFSVLHEETLEPVYRMGIPVNIRNTNNPSAPGTLIAPTRPHTGNPVVGIASDAGFCSLFVSKYMMNREIGFGRRLLQILEDERVSYEHTPSGIDNISVIIKEKYFTPGVEERILQRIREELKVDHVDIEHNLALVMVVGEGMMRTVGIAARATSALAKLDVNIQMINQGSSEVSMMFGVHADDANRAVQTLYNEFFR